MWLQHPRDLAWLVRREWAGPSWQGPRRWVAPTCVWAGEGCCPGRGMCRILVNTAERGQAAARVWGLTQTDSEGTQTGQSLPLCGVGRGAAVFRGFLDVTHFSSLGRNSQGWGSWKETVGPCFPGVEHQGRMGGAALSPPLHGAGLPEDLLLSGAGLSQEVIQ